MWQIARSYDWFVERCHSLAGVARRIIKLIATNRRLAAGVAIGVLTIAVFSIGYVAWKSRQEANAAALLFKAVSQLGSQSGTPEEIGNERKDGLRLLRELTTSYPKTAAAAEATLRLGTHYYTLGNYDEVRNVYQTYLTKNPKGRVAFAAGLGIGDAYLAQGKDDKALQTYEQLIKLFPQEPLVPQAYLNLARAHLHMKREKSATQLYQKVVETYQNTGWAQYAQAQLRKLVRQ